MKPWRMALLLLGVAWASAIACGGKVVVEAGGAGGDDDPHTTTATWTSTTWTTGTGTGTWTTTTWTTGTGTGTWTTTTWTQTGTGTGTPYCNEPDCYMQCECLHPYGVDMFYAIVDCAICGACHDVCGPEYGSYCGGGWQEQGCSAEFLNCGYGDCCEECVNSECSLYGLCGDALQACYDEPDCSQLMDCYSNC